MNKPVTIAAVILVLAVLLIGVPSLIRMGVQSSGDHPALGDVRTVISAEDAFKTVNGGVYAPLPCLESPSACLPGYDGPAFLDPTMASLETRSGYLRRFYPGPRLTPEEIAQAKAAPGSFREYAYVAIPEKAGAGARAFCGDQTGRVCAATSGTLPDLPDGRCPRTSCEPIQ